MGPDGISSVMLEHLGSAAIRFMTQMLHPAWIMLLNWHPINMGFSKFHSTTTSHYLEDYRWTNSETTTTQNSSCRTV